MTEYDIKNEHSSTTNYFDIFETNHSLKEEDGRDVNDKAIIMQKRKFDGRNDIIFRRSCW